MYEDILDGFSDRNDIIEQFNLTGEHARRIRDAVKLAGEYWSGNWEGSAEVILETPDGEIYALTGGHCSCYGLEGTGVPDLVNREYILNYKGGRGPNLTDAVRKLWGESLVGSSTEAQ